MSEGATWRGAAALALLLLHTGCTPALPPEPSPPSPAPAAGDDATALAMQVAAVQMRGNTLGRLYALDALARSVPPGSDTTVLALERMRNLAELGRIGAAHRVADLLLNAPGRRRIAPPALPSDLRRGDAVEEVARRAATERVVMVNEAHHVPQHRALVLRLLPLLREHGFTHFAAETLFASDADLQRRGFPTARSGAYVQEPLYGELIREALRLGYVVVPYEHPGPEDARERGQAANLARVLEEDPGARLLVHAGYTHVAHAAPPGSPPRMAARFRERTGIPPFTVDQTTLSEHGGREYEHPLYPVLARGTEAAVLLMPDGRMWSERPDWYDATVVHPRTRGVRGRPHWLRLGGARMDAAVPAAVCARVRPCLVEARYEGEPNAAVPVDRFHVEARERMPVLVLPPGRFRVRGEEPDGRVVGEALLIVR